MHLKENGGQVPGLSVYPARTGILGEVAFRQESV